MKCPARKHLRFMYLPVAGLAIVVPVPSPSQIILFAALVKEKHARPVGKQQSVCNPCGGECVSSLEEACYRADIEHAAGKAATAGGVSDVGARGTQTTETTVCDHAIVSRTWRLRKNPVHLGTPVCSCRSRLVHVRLLRGSQQSRIESMRPEGISSTGKKKSEEHEG